MIHGIDKIEDALERFEQTLQAHKEDVPVAIRGRLLKSIAEYPSILYGFFIGAVDYHENLAVGGSSFEIDASKDDFVTYDGFLEFPTRNVNGTVRPGRFHYGEAIETTDFEQIFDKIAMESFVI